MAPIPLKIIQWLCKRLKIQNYEFYKDEHTNKSCVFVFYITHTSDMKTYVPILASGIFRQASA